MKKILVLVLSSILVFSLIGCAGQAKNESSDSNEGTPGQELLEGNKNSEDGSLKSENSTEQGDSVLDYYPFVKNRVMEYKGIGNEYAEMKTYIEYIEDDSIQIKTVNPGTTVVNVLEYKDGVLKEVFSEGEFYHIENMLDVSRNVDNIILKEPIEIGNSWEDKEGNKVEITSLKQDIDTPSGKYKALEVTTSYENNSTKKDYYVKEFGYVGNIYEDGDFEIKSLLENINNDGMEVPVKAYYPLVEEVGSKYINKDIVFNTNDDIKLILEELLKNPKSDKMIAALPENININRINLNRDNWTLDVDLSDGFIKEMNAGSSYEAEIIGSIVNTLGNFFDVEKVSISVGGEPYSSGHLQLLEGEYFEVDTEGIEEFKLKK